MYDASNTHLNIPCHENIQIIWWGCHYWVRPLKQSLSGYADMPEFKTLV
jgi:hypothetical protein